MKTVIEDAMLNGGEECHPRQHSNETTDHRKEGGVGKNEKNGMFFRLLVVKNGKSVPVNFYQF